MLYCIIGPSGSGKSSVVNKLIEMGYKAPDSYTTRPKRNPNETGHTFITDEEYDMLDDVVANTVFNGYKYCVTREMLEGCNLYVVDPEGVRTLEKHGYFDFKVIGLELDASSCAVRMLSRGDKVEDILGRLDNDWYIFKDFDTICDYKINASNDISVIVDDIIKIMKDVEGN